MKLNWFGKNKRYNRSGADVSISVTSGDKRKDGTQRRRVNFYFRNGCELNFTKNRFVQLAMTGDRIYFDTDTEQHGYCISSKGNQGSINMTLGSNDTATGFTEKTTNGWIGDYTLKYDTDVKYWYIDANEKK